MERIKRWKEKILCSTRYHSSRSHSRLGYWLVVIAGSACLVGCTTLKKAGIVGLAGGSGALAGGLVSSGILAPVVGAVATSAVADVVTEATSIGGVKNNAMNDCAPDNFWSLLGSLVEMGGWFLLLLILVPMVLGWVLPGPLERKKKSSS